MALVGRMRPGVTVPDLDAGAEPAGAAPARAVRRVARLRRADQEAPARGAPAGGAAGGPGGRPDLDPVRVGGGRAAHRLRQRGQPVPGPRRAAAAGAGRPPRHRRRPAAALPRADHRGARRRPARRRARHGAGLGQRPALSQVRAARRAPHRRRRGALEHAALHRRRLGARGAPLRRAAGRCARPSRASIGCATAAAGPPRRRHWARDGLVVAQTALALVLLTGSALLFRSFQEMRNVDPGYDTRDIFTFQIAPEGEQLHDARSFARFHLAFMERLAHLPGVESVGIVDNVPLNESLADGRFLPAERAGETGGGMRLGLTSVAGDYFSTMGIRLLAGRTVHRGGPAHRPGARDRQPVGGEPAVAGAVADRAAAQAGGDPRLGDRRRRGGGRDAGQLPRSGAAGGLLSAGRAAARGLGDLVAGVRGEDAAGGDDRARDPGAGARAGARRADVPDLHHGGARRPTRGCRWRSPC